MDAVAFAKALADRFQAVVPTGFVVSAEGTTLWFELGEGRGFFGGKAGSYAVENFFSSLAEGSIEDRASQAALFAMNDLQDYVDEESTEPWPGAHTPPPAHAVVRDGRLYMWFGEEGDEDLALLPVELD